MGEPVYVRLGRPLARRVGWLVDAAWAALRAPVRVEDTIYIAGAPRSGSTWLEEVLERLLRGYRSVHEPLSARFSPEAARALARLPYPVPPNRFYAHHAVEEPWLTELLSRVLRGLVVPRSTGKPRRILEKLARMGAGRIIVKDVTTTRLLPYMAARFRTRLSILIVRHPCAVVESLLRLHARESRPPTPAEAARLARNLARQAEATVEASDVDPRFIASLSTPEEVEAATWALDYLVPLEYAGRGWYHIVYYEELARDPAGGFGEILRLLGERPARDPREAARRPSATALARPGAGRPRGCTARLGRERAQRVLRVVHRIGVNVYEEGELPVYKP